MPTIQFFIHKILFHVRNKTEKTDYFIRWIYSPIIKTEQVLYGLCLRTRVHAQARASFVPGRLYPSHVCCYQPSGEERRGHGIDCRPVNLIFWGSPSYSRPTKCISALLCCIVAIDQTSVLPNYLLGKFLLSTWYRIFEHIHLKA